MKKFILILSMVVALPLCARAQSIQYVHDKDNFNQFASQEFKQWKFTPESWYYSWYYKSVLGIKVKLPGSGTHDKGFAGIEIGGDNYVNERWRQMSLLRAETNGLHNVETEKFKDENEDWHDVYNRDLATEVDRVIDTGYEETKTRRDQLKEEIETNIAVMGDKGEDALMDYKRILENIEDVKDSHMDSSKKLTAYKKEEAALEELAMVTNAAGILIYINKEFEFLNDDEEGGAE